MRIGYIRAPGCPQVDMLARYVVDAGHEAHVFTPASEPVDIPGVVEHRVAVASYPLFKHPPHDLAFAEQIAALEGGLDVLHVHGAVPLGATALLARAMSPTPMSVIITLAPGEAETPADDPDGRIIKQVMSAADGILIPPESEDAMYAPEGPGMRVLMGGAETAGFAHLQIYTVASGRIGCSGGD